MTDATPTRILLSTEGDAQTLTTLDEFLAANDGMHDVEVGLIRSTLAGGKDYLGGGGAVPEFRLSTTLPQYLVAFPDYGLLDVTIPNGFDDRSWHNDACPCWINETLHLRLMIDYADRSKSEAAQVFGGEYHRFQLDRLTDDNQVRDIAPPRFLTFATYDEALAVIIGEQFAYDLSEQISHRDWLEMLAQNATPEYAEACASHDHCDANMVMEGAMQSLGFDLGAVEDWASETTPESKRLVGLWNAAWDYAKPDHLTAK